MPTRVKNGLIDDVVSVKDFGAKGTGLVDDTAAIQAAIDYCFGSAASPHGIAGVLLNKPLYFPPGQYNITAPLILTKLVGARIFGAGRFVTKIQQGPINTSLFVTNGCSYSSFEDMTLTCAVIGGTGKLFDLSWDNSAGGSALQANRFQDMYFYGGAYGVSIGAGGYMGSENMFINCFFSTCNIAGLKTHNFNALQNTVIGGNFQLCATGITTTGGSFCIVQGVGFQLSTEWDIETGVYAGDTMMITGCRTESLNFVNNAGSHLMRILGCTQTGLGLGEFADVKGEVTIANCYSWEGRVTVQSVANVRIENCQFRKRNDWLNLPGYNNSYYPWSVEVENVAYNQGSDPEAYQHIRKRQYKAPDGVTLKAYDYDPAIQVTSTHGAGAADTLTTTPTAVDFTAAFGATDPSITLTKAGLYRIRGIVAICLVGATFGASQTVTVKFRRTNNTAADLVGGSATVATGIVTASTELLAEVTLPTIEYVTANTNDIITIFASVDALPSAGTITATPAPCWISAELIAPASISAVAAGTAYALTATPAAIDCGTTDPSITINAAGTYVINGQVNLAYNGATFAANRTVTLKFRRTNNTAADLTNGIIAVTTGVVTTITQSFLTVRIPEIEYTTANSDDIITIFADVSTAPSAGSLDAVASGTWIKASLKV